MAMVTVYVPNVTHTDKPIYVKKGNLYYRTPLYTKRDISFYFKNWRVKTYFIDFSENEETNIKSWSEILFSKDCPKPIDVSELGLVFVSTRFTINLKQKPLHVSYSVQAVYKGRGQDWCNWMSNLSFKEAKNLLNRGNSLVSNLRIIKIETTIVK